MKIHRLAIQFAPKFKFAPSLRLNGFLVMSAAAQAVE